MDLESGIAFERTLKNQLLKNQLMKSQLLKNQLLKNHLLKNKPLKNQQSQKKKTQTTKVTAKNCEPQRKGGDKKHPETPGWSSEEQTIFRDPAVVAYSATSSPQFHLNATTTHNQRLAIHKSAHSSNAQSIADSSVVEARHANYRPNYSDSFTNIGIPSTVTYFERQFSEEELLSYRQQDSMKTIDSQPPPPQNDIGVPSSLSMGLLNQLTQHGNFPSTKEQTEIEKNKPAWP